MTALNSELILNQPGALYVDEALPRQVVSARLDFMRHFFPSLDQPDKRDPIFQLEVPGFANLSPDLVLHILATRFEYGLASRSGEPLDVSHPDESVMRTLHMVQSLGMQAAFSGIELSTEIVSMPPSTRLYKDLQGQQRQTMLGTGYGVALIREETEQRPALRDSVSLTHWMNGAQNYRINGLLFEPWFDKERHCAEGAIHLYVSA
jgi:hypothetical protein